jgi:hypothetical protein
LDLSFPAFNCLRSSVLLRLRLSDKIEWVSVLGEVDNAYGRSQYRKVDQPGL